MHVVAPRRVSTLQWLASDEDEARTEAEVRALEAEWTLSDEAEAEGEAGDVDPVQAVADALRTFPADEILLVGRGEGGIEASLRDFGCRSRESAARSRSADATGSASVHVGSPQAAAGRRRSSSSRASTSLCSSWPQ